MADLRPRALTRKERRDLVRSSGAQSIERTACPSCRWFGAERVRRHGPCGTCFDQGFVEWRVANLSAVSLVAGSAWEETPLFEVPEPE